MRTKTLREDMVNKGSRFADFERFCPHTCARTQQSPIAVVWETSCTNGYSRCRSYIGGQCLREHCVWVCGRAWVSGAGSRWGLHSTAGCVGRALVFMWNSGFSVIFCWCRGGGEGVRFGGGLGTGL